MYWDKDTDGARVMWSTVKEVRVTHRDPAIIYFRYGSKQEEKIVVNPEADFDLVLYDLERAYDKPLPPALKKLKDFKMFLKKKIVPHRFRPFYENLTRE